MTTIFDTASAGLRRSTRAVETIAQNVANAETEGYHAQRYDGGMDAVVPRAASDRGRASSGVQEVETPSDVDLAAEFIDLRRQQVAYDANAALVRVGDQMLGELLDLIG